MRPFIVEFVGTPEAGKTTSVKMLRRSLEEKGYKVGLVRESAEIVPDMFKTGSSKGNIWMTLKTAQKLYEEINNDRDIVLVDRGVVDILSRGTICMLNVVNFPKKKANALKISLKLLELRLISL